MSGLNFENKIYSSLEIFNNQSLSDLQELISIDTVFGSLSIGANPSLLDLDGLSSLKYVSNNLGLGQQSLLGLEALRLIGGSLFIRNHNITELAGLNSLTRINGGFTINENSLEDFSGLTSLKYIGGDLRFGDENSLKSFEGLDSLTTIGGELYINESFYVTNFEGLGVLSSIGDIAVYDCPLITNLEGLRSLATADAIRFYNSNGLLDLSGLSSIKHIGMLLLYDNDMLQNLRGIESLESISYLDIQGNISLTDISALGNNLAFNSNNPDSIMGLSIAHNTSLSKCAIVPICRFLEYNTNSYLHIYNNGNGCLNESQVIDSCTSNLDIRHSENKFYPNPAQDFIHLLFPSPDIRIFNALGKVIFTKANSTSYFDISNFDQGIYLIEISDNERTYLEKLVICR